MKAGAIFDMDGLMFDTERLYQENWQKIANEMGIVLPDPGEHIVQHFRLIVRAFLR